MPKVKFISTLYLKENTTIEDNTDDAKLVPFIYKVQDTHLQQILGTTFYNYLKNAVVSGTTTDNDTTLLRDFIQPMVAEWVLYESIPFLNFKLTNKAVSTENSEYSTATNLDDIKYLRHSIRDLAEFYSSRLTKYLCDNSNLYPVYQNPDAKENLHKSSKVYFNGIYIQKKYGVNGIPSYYDPTRDCYNC